MNLYATLTDIKVRLDITAATDDAVLLAYLEAASREVDNLCHRHFYVETATRYFDTRSDFAELLIDDVLSVTTFTTDSELDGTYDGETWTEGPTNDFVLWPWNTWPKTEIQVAVQGDYSLPKNAKRYLKIIGLFGYGDGKSATPYEAAGVTVTVANGVLTTITVSANDVIEPGHTILAGTEQMYVSAVGVLSFTAERGVNGTTGVAQAGAAASIYRYPKLITQAVEIAAGDLYNNEGTEGFSAERIGDYSYQKLTNRGDAMIKEVLGRFVGSYMKAVVA
jgi:hypothetical protein